MIEQKSTTNQGQIFKMESLEELAKYCRKLPEEEKKGNALDVIDKLYTLVKQEFKHRGNIGDIVFNYNILVHSMWEGQEMPISVGYIEEEIRDEKLRRQKLEQKANEKPGQETRVAGERNYKEVIDEINKTYFFPALKKINVKPYMTNPEFVEFFVERLEAIINTSINENRQKGNLAYISQLKEQREEYEKYAQSILTKDQRTAGEIMARVLKPWDREIGNAQVGYWGPQPQNNNHR